MNTPISYLLASVTEVMIEQISNGNDTGYLYVTDESEVTYHRKKHRTEMCLEYYFSPQSGLNLIGRTIL